ncbi:MAG: hypothetical protein KIS66_07175 [Fimbriimonadaceae bacterium]|nr:hypothetical protein [Fimbriimonadaceae bacterium]
MRLSAIPKEQYRYLRSFSADVALGIVPRTSAIRARARLYAESARRTHFETERRLMAGRGYVEERSVLGIADHCDGCLEEAGKGWRPIGTLSPIGGRDCKARCRCHFVYRKADALGQTEADENLAVRDRPDLAGLPEAEFVEQIRGAKNEVVAAYRDGEQLFTPREGSRNRVSLPSGADLTGATVVHNHPDDLPPSPEDLANGRKRGFARLVIPTPNRTFRVSTEAEWPDPESAESVWRGAWDLANQDADADLARHLVEHDGNHLGEAWMIGRLDAHYEEHWIRLTGQRGVTIKVE